jgi:hypothetical protein
MKPVAENPSSRLTTGHDWEEIFESPEHGIIQLLRQAKTIDGLRQCTQLIISSLFTRDDDAPIRKVYEQSLDDMLPRTGANMPPMDRGVSRVIQLLREIKMHRQKKHEQHERQRMAGKPVSPETERRDSGDPLPGLEISQTLETPVAQNDAHDIDIIFTDLFCDRISQRLAVLNNSINADSNQGEAPPFILSKDFASHFDNLLREYFIPAFLKDSRALIAQTAQQSPQSRRDYLIGQFDGRVSSQNLWDKWQETWAMLVRVQELPEKPKPEKKSGLLAGLKKKKQKKKPAWMREMTIEEWQVRIKEIKAANKKAKKLWALIASDSDAYQSPKFSDEKLLMDLFARSAKGLQNHINALRQTAEQGADVGRGLSTYAQGKNIDLPLLAVCLQSPSLFLGDGKGLKKMTMAMDEVEISKAYPLVKRFLGANL